MTGDRQTTIPYENVGIAARGRRERVRWRTGLLALMLAAGVALGGAVPYAVSDEPPVEPLQIPKTDLKSGKITAKGEKSVEISGHGYAFQKNIVFADDEGERREWAEFKNRDLVQFHLKQGQIDYLILVPPK